MAKRRYPELFLSMTRALHESDPLADACIEELWTYDSTERNRFIDAALTGTPSPLPRLADLVRQATRFPAWVDWKRLNRAGAILRRAGILGGLALGLKSLVLGYASPAGNKPLALSGALTTRADRRLAETARFVASVCEPDGLRSGGEGFRTTLRVRLMHARVRRLCRDDPRYDRLKFGEPINQHDMLATILLFSWIFTVGIRELGVVVTAEEAEDYLYLFRVVGVIIGVREDLLPTSVPDAQARAEFIRLTQGRPDDDSRALVGALLDGPLRQARGPVQERLARTHRDVATQLCRDLIGRELADQLGLPQGGRLRPLTTLRTTVALLEQLRRRSGTLSDQVERWGANYYDFSVKRGLSGGLPRFALPERLGS